MSARRPESPGPSDEQLDALARGLGCQAPPPVEALLPGIQAAAARRRRSERVRLAAAGLALLGAGWAACLALPRPLGLPGGADWERPLASDRPTAPAPRPEPAAPQPAAGQRRSELFDPALAAADAPTSSRASDPAGARSGSTGPETDSPAARSGGWQAAGGDPAQIWSRTGALWSELARATGAPAGSPEQLRVWIESAPPLASELRRTFWTLRSAEPAAGLPEGIAEALEDRERPIEQRLGALLWISQSRERGAGALLRAAAERSDALGAMALRILAVGPAADRDLALALADPARAASAAAALAEWPAERARARLERAWSEALAAEPAWPQGALAGLAARVLARGPEALGLLLEPLHAPGRPAGGRAQAQAALAAALRSAPEADRPALIAALASAVAERRSESAVALLAELPYPGALLALLDLERLGRGPAGALERALSQAPVGSPTVWAAAARSSLSRAEAEGLLDRALAQGAAAPWVAPLLARTDLPRDARLWLIEAVDRAGDAAAAAELLAACLGLPCGEERLVAAALHSAARILGLPAVEAELARSLPPDQTARLAEALRRGGDGSHPARLAELLRRCLPLAPPAAPAMG